MIYSIIDMHAGMRSPHNLVFNPFDFRSIEGCRECLTALNMGDIALSHRWMVPVDILEE